MQLRFKPYWSCRSRSPRSLGYPCRAPWRLPIFYFGFKTSEGLFDLNDLDPRQIAKNHQQQW